jgi:phage terminase small subunit
MQLSERRAKFVDEYILDHNGSRAARSAGYAASGARVTAHRLLTDANVKAAIALKSHELAKSYEINRQRVVKELLIAVDVARCKLDPGNMIRAWCEIAKILGIYNPETIKVELDSELKIPWSHFESMSDEELMAIVNNNIK